MQPNIVIFILVISFSILDLSVPGFSADSEADFVSLFNGKNLDGWNIENGDENTFVVQSDVIYCSGKRGYPAWLRSEKEYENFDLRFEFRRVGWCNSGIFFEAPKYGRISRTGFELQIDQKTKEPITAKSCGAIFEVVPPLVFPPTNDVPLRNSGEWNTGRILMDWPHLQAWMNDVPVQDLNVEEYPELKYRLRRGFIGLQDMGYPVWFRNIRIKELPSKESGKWVDLYNGKNFDGWYIEGKGAIWTPLDGVIRAEGATSYLVTEGEWENFELFTYVRTSRNANGGIFFRWKTLAGGDRGNEIQIENVPDSNYPTGSLYNIVRAPQVYWQDEQWFPMQIRVEGSHVVVRVNGETVVDYPDQKIIRPGHISLQMHQVGTWEEFNGMKIKKL